MHIILGGGKFEKGLTVWDPFKHLCKLLKGPFNLQDPWKLFKYVLSSIERNTKWQFNSRLIDNKYIIHFAYIFNNWMNGVAELCRTH